MGNGVSYGSVPDGTEKSRMAAAAENILIVKLPYCHSVPSVVHYTRRTQLSGTLLMTEIPAFVPTTIAANLAGLSRRAFVRHVRPQLVNSRGTWVATEALEAHLGRPLTASDIVRAQMARRTQYRTSPSTADRQRNRTRIDHGNGDNGQGLTP
jgi:hypothetical protein